jgi:hypothetical protein
MAGLRIFAKTIDAQLQKIQIVPRGDDNAKHGRRFGLLECEYRLSPRCDRESGVCM